MTVAVGRVMDSPTFSVAPAGMSVILGGVTTDSGTVAVADPYALVPT